MIRPRVHEKAPRTLRLVSALRGSVAAVILLLCCDAATIAAESSFKVLALYSTNVEPDHVHFANDALDFFRALAAKSIKLESQEDPQKEIDRQKKNR